MNMFVKNVGGSGDQKGQTRNPELALVAKVIIGMASPNKISPFEGFFVLMKKTDRNCCICSKKIKNCYLSQYVCKRNDGKLSQCELKRKAGNENYKKYLTARKRRITRKKKKREAGEGALRYCLGALCQGEKLFKSRHKFNRICESCMRTL